MPKIYQHLIVRRHGIECVGPAIETLRMASVDHGRYYAGIVDCRDAMSLLTIETPHAQTCTQWLYAGGPQTKRHVHHKLQPIAKSTHIAMLNIHQIRHHTLKPIYSLTFLQAYQKQQTTKHTLTSQHTSTLTTSTADTQPAS